jgi:rare lipoprotein A (peptidoglycan hydrolase)
MMNWLGAIGVCLVALMVFLFGVALVTTPSNAATACPPSFASGTASWYSWESCSTAACLTASGEPYDPMAMTAAMPSRSMLGKRVRVIRGDRSVTVRINDTGSFAKYGRAIDLSLRAADALGMVQDGIAEVCWAEVP